MQTKETEATTFDATSPKPMIVAALQAKVEAEYRRLVNLAIDDPNALTLVDLAPALIFRRGSSQLDIASAFERFATDIKQTLSLRRAGR